MVPVVSLLPDPGACVGFMDWSAAAAAPGQSTLAGVLAGFVFGGIVVMLSVRVPSRSEDAARALKLLFSAFFGLAVVAYLLADQAADTNCLRAASEETLSGGILGTFAIVMIVALTWLVVSYELHTFGALRFLQHLVYFAAAFVALLLCTSAYGYLQGEVPGGPPQLVIVLIYLVGGLLYLISLPVASRMAEFFPMPTWRPSASGGLAVAREARGVHRMLHASVDRCAWAALGYLAVAAIADAVVLGLPGSAWDRPVVPVVYLIGWSSLVLPLIVLILAVRALAPVPEDPDQEHSPAPADPQPAAHDSPGERR